MSTTRQQTWQQVNQNGLDALETGERESLDNLLEVLDSKINFPFRTKLDSINNQLEINPSEIQSLKANPLADEWGATENSYKAGTSPINGQYKTFGLSTINFTTGLTAGNFTGDAQSSAPSLNSGEFIWVGVEATGTSPSPTTPNEGSFQLVWGNPHSVSDEATYPSFSGGTSVALILLQSASTGPWGFHTPKNEDVILFRGSGGGGGGAGTLDFVPQYKSSSEFRLIDTQNRRSKFNDKYFYISENLDFSYIIPSPVGEYTYNICIDTNLPGGEINSTNTDPSTASGYVVATDLDPAHPVFPDNLAVVGYYTVIDGAVTQQNLGTYSVKEIDTFLGDLAPTYNDPSSFRIQGTSGRIVDLNKNYYYLNEDLVVDFDLSSSGIRNICIDTRTGTEELSGFVGPQGEIEVHEEHIVQSSLDPNSVAFPQNLIPLGSYVVNSSLEVSLTGFSTTSERFSNRMIGDFVPSFVDDNSFRINRTRGVKVKLIENYFWAEHDVESTFEKSVSGYWFMCIDTAATVGESLTGFAIDSSFIICTQESPTSTSFPPDYVAIGEYFVPVAGGSIPSDKFKPYSVAGAGSGGGNSDFVPNYKNEAVLSIRATSGRRALVNGRYYYTVNEIEKTYNKTIDGTWYVSINTDPDNYSHTGNNGELDSTDVVLTSSSEAVPRGQAWNPYLVPVGEYEVAGGEVVKAEFKGYSTREMMTWAYGLPNVKRKTKVHASTESTSSFSYDFNHSPSVINYRYWDSSDKKFYQFPRADVEIYNTPDEVFYNIPFDDPKITWDADDFFEVEAIYYAYTDEGGFASPKTDHTEGWFAATPPIYMAHPLKARPQNISLEFWNTTDPANSFYYVVDGNQYVDKNPSKGITNNEVYFDWEALPVLSSNVKMKIHFNISKTSAGAFEADRNELGTVKVTGLTTTALSPDIILKDGDTEFATIINDSGDNSTVLVKESITITTPQDITANGISFNMLPGAYIICETSIPSSSIVKFSGEDFEVENLRILSTESSQEALGLDGSGIVKNILVKQDFEGPGTRTLGHAVRVYTGNIVTLTGRSKSMNNGIISDKFTDDDGYSEIAVS